MKHFAVANMKDQQSITKTFTIFFHSLNSDHFCLICAAEVAIGDVVDDKHNRVRHHECP